MTVADQRVVTTLAIDAATIRVVTALRDRGIEPILLKGRSFATWLYAPDEHRFYGDCDLLVAPEKRSVAEAVLRTSGFEASPVPPGPQHAQAWCRPSDHAEMDLHTTIWGVADPALAWQELSRCTEAQRFGPIAVTVLDEPGRCLQVVLHWVHHGVSEVQGADLDRAFARVADGTWARAADLASRLGTGDTFVHGLLAHPVGAQLAGRLGLVPNRPPTLADLLRISGDATGAATLERIIGLPGWRVRARAVGHKLVPPPAYLRVVIPYDRRRPTPPTVRLYLRYWRRQAIRAPGGLWSWCSARQSLRPRHRTR